MKKHIMIFSLIFFVTIGFASVSTVLDIKGNVNIAENLEDFKIEITNLKINNDAKDELISANKQSFTFTGTGKDSLEYTVENLSTQYDANINLVCIPNDNVTIEQIENLSAQDVMTKTISTTNTNEITCTINVEKISRTGYADELCSYNEGKTWVFNYTGDEQQFNVPCNGKYRIELWGASGGNAFGIHENVGGNGSYVSGNVRLSTDEELFINVGGRGEDANKVGSSYDGTTRVSLGGYNGGGSVRGIGQCVGAAGGGATSLALVSGELATLSEKKDQILMVASGGGGASLDINNRSSYEGSGGAGGIINGYRGKTQGNTQCLAYGASQTSGGTSCNTQIYGYFGGSNYTGTSIDIDGGGGGSGWYGGGNSICSGGGGGSSYINENTIFDSLNNDYLFSSIVAYDGESNEMPSHDGTTTMTGNIGNGYVKITLVSKQMNSGEFDYTGSEQIFIAPSSGYYKLETWGAQGGNYDALDRNGYSSHNLGGKGAYSTGKTYLKKGDKLYVNVGGAGKNLIANSSDYHRMGVSGGYNGGGTGGNGYSSGFPGGAGGGGATHIATQSGKLSTLEENKDKILIVSGGGGGAGWTSGGGSGGGMNGVTVNVTRISTGGTQENGYAFGIGSPGYAGYNTAGSAEGSSGSGGGLYGGSTFISNGSTESSIAGAGGSGYIGNSNLEEKHMTCFNCETSEDELTMTITVTESSEEPISDKAKQGNGYARITYLGN